MTAHQYQQNLDRTAPLTKRWGGRLLAMAEADALEVDTEPVEYVAMNLTHLQNDLFQCDVPPVMSPENLAALYTLADRLEAVAETYTDAVETIRRVVPDLWRYRVNDDA